MADRLKIDFALIHKETTLAWQGLTLREPVTKLLSVEELIEKDDDAKVDRPPVCAQGSYISINYDRAEKRLLVRKNVGLQFHGFSKFIIMFCL